MTEKSYLSLVMILQLLTPDAGFNTVIVYQGQKENCAVHIVSHHDKQTCT